MQELVLACFDSPLCLPAASTLLPRELLKQAILDRCPFLSSDVEASAEFWIVVLRLPFNPLSSCPL